MIELSHIYKTFAGPVHALRNVDIHIQKSEFVFITGPSGAGKTTLFRMLAGFDQPTSGQLKVAGFDLNQMTSPQKPLFRRKLGVVFQDFKLLKDQSALENVAMPLLIRGEKKARSLELASVFLQKVGLQDRQDMKTETLSGGEAQRVALARAIIHQPDIILADEPTGNLDQERSEEIMNLLEFCTKSGMTVLVTTHDLDLVRRRKQRIISIKNGEVVKDGRA